MKQPIARTMKYAALTISVALMSVSAFAADQMSGRVEAGGAPVSGADVTLWLAGPSAPQKLAEAKTSDDGSYDLSLADGKGDVGVLYLIAAGGESKLTSGTGPNPATTLMATLGAELPERVTINELTTVASVWTAAQFLNGTVLCGDVLRLQIAAGNVPNLVNLETGGLGAVIQDPLNSSQTTTLAKLNTLAILLTACVAEIPDACNKFFEAATPPGGVTPTDTLSAAQNIARHPGHQADKLFGLLDEFYPVPAGKRWREVALIPYLNFAPSAWTLSLVYSGGGYCGVGGIAIDGEGNMWSANNFLVGSQTTIFEWVGGGISKFAPNGKPLSPMIKGFSGGGVDSAGWGIAVSADDKVWVTSLIGKTISVFDRKTGKPLSPETGYNFDGKLGAMQGLIVAPNGDVWTLDNEHSQIVYLPKGDASKGRIYGRVVDGKPVDGTLQLNKPFGLAIDQQDRIWVSNSGSDTVTRFPASDPGKAVDFKVGFSPHGIAIDSQGNVWVANSIGHPGTREKLAFVKEKFKAKFASDKGSMSADDLAAKEWIDLWEISDKYPGGDVSMIRPDGTVLGPFDAGKTMNGAWGISIDGNDNVWVSDSMSSSITHLCGVRTETCPPGLKTGDPISPPGGYIGGLKTITGIALDPAGNVWVANSWDQTRAGFKEVPDEALSTRFAADSTVVFFGLAKPIRTPLLGPVEVQ
jgi:DNA-binding beta-propeller fold protein YncE